MIYVETPPPCRCVADECCVQTDTTPDAPLTFSIYFWFLFIVHMFINLFALNIFLSAFWEHFTILSI